VAPLSPSPERARVTALEEFFVQDGTTVPALDMSALAAAAFMAPDSKFYMDVSLELGLGRSKLVVQPQAVRLRSSDTTDKFMDLRPDHVKYEVLVQVSGGRSWGQVVGAGRGGGWVRSGSTHVRRRWAVYVLSRVRGLHPIPHP
jgi:hypothetical protein